MIINRWLPLGQRFATLVYQSRSVTSGGASSRTLSFTCTSAAGQERLVGLVSIASGNPASVTYSSVQIDGQTATQVGSYVTVLDGAGNGPTVSFWRATGTSGTSINVTYTIATGAVFDARGALWTLNDAGTLYDSQAVTATNTGDINLSLDTDTITNGATAAVFLAYGSSARAATWTGLTERYDGTADDLYGVDWFGAADLDVSSGSTPLTITADLPSDFSGNPAAAGLAVSFNLVGAAGSDSVTVTAGAVALTGKTVTVSDSVAVSKATLALTGKTVTVVDGDVVVVSAGALSLTGKTVTVSDSIAVAKATLALAGKTITASDGGGGALWTPSEIAGSLGFWLQADTVSGSGGSHLTTWEDSGPDNYDLTKTGTNGPEIINPGLDGKKTLTVAPGSSHQTMAGASRQFTDFGIYAVWKGDGGGAARFLDHDYAEGFWIGLDYPDAAKWGGGIKYPDPPFGTFLTFDFTDWHITAFGRAGTAGFVRADGGVVEATPTVDGSETVSHAILLGASDTGGTTAPSALDVAEIVCLDANVTSTNRDLIEGYLAWKWGLEGLLDAGHPYKSAAPTTGGGGDDSVTVAAATLSLSGKTVTIADGQSIPVTASAVALSGKTISVADSVAVAKATLALAGKTVTVATIGANEILVSAAAIALTGKTVTVADVVNVITVDRATIVLSGGIVAATDSGPGISTTPRVGYDDVGRATRRRAKGLRRAERALERLRAERERIADQRRTALEAQKKREDDYEAELKRLQTEIPVVPARLPEIARSQQIIDALLREAHRPIPQEMQHRLDARLVDELRAEMDREETILLEAAHREEESILSLLKELLLAYRGK